MQTEEYEFTSKSNPFHDPNLDKVFVWKKMAKKRGWDKEEAKRQAKLTREQNLVDIEVAKRRRVERDEEMMSKLEERDRKDRERESAAHADWESREEEFMLKQHKQAAVLRINQGRETPADLLARNVLLMRQLQLGPEIGPDGKETFALSPLVGVNETCVPLNVIQPGNAKEIRLQVQRYQQLETVPLFQQYWAALLVCCDDALQVSSSSQQRVPQAVRDSIREYCEMKTVEQIRMEKLDSVQREKEQAQSSSSGEDAAFFRELQSVWQVEETRRQASELFDEMVRFCKQHGRAHHHIPMWDLATQHQQQSSSSYRRSSAGQNDEDDDGDVEDVAAASSSSTAKRSESALIECCLVGSSTAERTVQPRFWNRVRMGYDWNKYNRAHYDADNRPPKMVLGYKFNIMFPGLQAAPTYRLEKYRSSSSDNNGGGSDDDQFCVIRFLADEPFVDIGFKIENRDWDRGAHSGFKNIYENGVLQLHFNFVRRRYRR